MAFLRYAIYASLAAASWTAASLVPRQTVANGSDISSCPGYKASDVHTSQNSLTATLALAGAPCNIYGTDIEDLVLSVQYETSKLPSTSALMQF
jgi:alpha-glucosidase